VLALDPSLHPAAFPLLALLDVPVDHAQWKTLDPGQGRRRRSYARGRPLTHNCLAYANPLRRSKVPTAAAAARARNAQRRRCRSIMALRGTVVFTQEGVPT